LALSVAPHTRCAPSSLLGCGPARSGTVVFFVFFRGFFFVFLHGFFFVFSFLFLKKSNFGYIFNFF
jgi:hypothetical protein